MTHGRIRQSRDTQTFITWYRQEVLRDAGSIILKVANKIDSAAVYCEE